MKFLTSTLGRIIFAIPFLVFGIMHLVKANDMSGYVPIPGGVFWIYLTGLAMIAAFVSIITKIQIKLATMLLALMLLIIIVTIHIPGLSNPQMMQITLTNLLKDAGLMGGALILAGTFVESEKK
jgi:putative oxidoreductase